MELIAVVMKCNAAEHYTDSAALFDYGFSNFESKVILSGTEYTSTVTVTEEYKNKIIERGTITIAPVGAISHVVPKGTDISAVTTEMNVPQTIEAPVEAGQAIGTMKVLLNGEHIKTIDLVAENGIALLTDAESRHWSCDPAGGFHYPPLHHPLHRLSEIQKTSGKTPQTCRSHERI